MDDPFINLIEEYLTGELPKETRAEFEQHMAVHPGFAKRVAMERELSEVLSSHRPEIDLRANLQRISEKFDTPESLNITAIPGRRFKPWLWWCFAAGLLIFAGILYWNTNGREKESTLNISPVHPVTPAQDPSPPAPGQLSPEVLPMERDKTPQTVEHKSSPIAAAFKPIPLLETYIGSQMRSGNNLVTLVEPKSGVSLPYQKGHTTIRFSGKIFGTIKSGSSFNLLIFNNNLHRFETMSALENHLLLLEPNGDFHWSPTLNLTPGLYYFLISEQESGDWLFVDKFLIQ